MHPHQAAEAVEEMVNLTIKTLAGHGHVINVPRRATFGHIKHKYIQPMQDFPAVQMRLIYMGHITDDNETPRDYNIVGESCLHLVRRCVACAA
jgi:hypothetical protein